MSTSNKDKLTCRLTGESRQSSHKYIAKKAEQHGVSSEEFVAYYVTKDAYKQLKARLTTHPISQILEKLDLDGQTVERILKYNGKSQKTLDDFKGKKKVEPEMATA